MPNYIALDQSLTNTGVAIYNDLSPKIFYLTIKTLPHQGRNERLFLIEEQLTNLIIKFEPSLVFTEQVFMSRTSAAIDLIRVETTIHNLLYKEEIDIQVMSSSTSKQTKYSWRNLLGVSSNKQELKMILQAQIDFSINNHEADAIGILLGGLTKLDKIKRTFSDYEIYPLYPETRKRKSNCKIAATAA